MASRRAIRTALSLLAVNFVGEVSEEKIQLWVRVLEDVTDEQLERAIPEVIKTHCRDYIPPVAVVREAAGANLDAAVDTDRILDSIERLGGYTLGGAWFAPRVSTVTEALGLAVGEAYAMAGGSRVLSDNATTREIAARDFQKALQAAGRVHRLPAEYLVGAGHGRSPLRAAEQRALPAGTIDRPEIEP